MPPKYRPSLKQPPTRNAALVSSQTSPPPHRHRHGKVVRAGEDEQPPPREDLAQEEPVREEEPAHEWLDPLLRARHAPTGDNAGICRHSPGASKPESSPLATSILPTDLDPATSSDPSSGTGKLFVREVGAFYAARSDWASRDYFGRLCADFDDGRLEAGGFYAQIFRLLHVSGAEHLVGRFRALVPKGWIKEFEERGVELLNGAAMAEKEAEVQGWAARVRMKVLEKMLEEEEQGVEGEGEWGDGEEDEHVTPAANGEGVASEGAAGDAPSDRQKWADLARTLSAEIDEDDDGVAEYPVSEYEDGDNDGIGDDGDNDYDADDDSNDIEMPDPTSHHGPATPAGQRKKKRPINGYRASPVSHIVGIDGSMFERASSLRRMSSGPPSSPAPALQVSFRSKTSATNSPAKASPAKAVARNGGMEKATPTKALSPGVLEKRAPKKVQGQERKSLVVRLRMPKGYTFPLPATVTTGTLHPRTTPADQNKNARAPTQAATPTRTALTTFFPLAARREQIIYPTTRAIFARAHKPYTHALCGQTFTHFEEVRRHHNGQAGRPGCWEKAGKPTGEVACWDAHASCRWSTKDIRWRAVKGGVVVDDWGSVALEWVRESWAGSVEGGQGKMGDDVGGEGRESKRRKVETDGKRKDGVGKEVSGGIKQNSNGGVESTAEPKPKRRKLEGGGREVDAMGAAEQAALRSAATGLRKRK